MHTRAAGPASTTSCTAGNRPTRSGLRLAALAALVALGACRDHDPVGPGSSPSPAPPQRSASWATPTRWVPMAPAASSDWEIRAAADMNGDGKADVVWQNRTTRQTGVWIMNGTTVQGWVAMPPAATSDWEIAAAADLSGDGRADIVWQNRATRQTGVWVMDGTSVQGWVALQSAATSEWEISGAADMNRDGMADIVWQNRTTLATGVWLMDRTTVTGWVAMSPAATGDWEIVGAADLSRDGSADVVWQNRATLGTGVWEMDGTAVRSWVAMPAAPSGAWQIGGVGDLSGDGRPDIVWQNRSTRETAVWEMGGSPAGLLAWYPFDEAAGDVAADFANAAPRSDLRLVGATRVPGKLRGGIGIGSSTYDASAYATGGADKNLGTGDFSIAFWIRLDPSRSAEVVVLDKRVTNPYRGYHLVIRGGEPLIQLADAGEYEGWYNYHSEIAGGALLDGRWHFLAVSVRRASGQGIRWYLDGAPAGRVDDPTRRQGSLSNDAPLLVGRHAFGLYGSPAELDELRIFRHALTQDEVSALLERDTYR